MTQAASKIPTLPKREPAPSKIPRELVAELKPRAAPYEVRDADRKGFLVRVQPSGVT